MARLIADGAWRQLSRGIYALEPDSFAQRAWAGVLIGGPRAVIGAQAAAHLHRLTPAQPDRITVFVGQETPRRRPDRRWEFIRGLRPGWGEPPRTAPDQTIIDLAGHTSPDELAPILSRAISGRQVDPAALVSLVARQPRAPGRRALLELLGGDPTGVDSPLEAHYDRRVARPHGLPPARRQANPTGSYRSDRLYEAYWLIVELDGLAYHLNKVADMARDNAHLVAGYRTLRFGWDQVTRHPCRVAADVAAALRQAGWTGQLRRCPDCPRPQ